MRQKCLGGGVRRRGNSFFRKRGPSYDKSERNSFYYKQDVKYFSVELLFQKKQYFPKKPRKTIFERGTSICEKERDAYRKKRIPTPFFIVLRMLTIISFGYFFVKGNIFRENRGQ